MAAAARQTKARERPILREPKAVLGHRPPRAASAPERNIKAHLRQVTETRLDNRPRRCNLLNEMTKMTRTLGLIAFIVMFLFSGAAAQTPARLVLVAEVDGVIGPPAAHHVARAIDSARTQNAEALILMINTPGGLETSMRDIVETILHSDVPVIGYVTPQGGRAASAGTFILYATHVAAMAPATNIGAATPVDLGGGGGGAEQDAEPDVSGTAMENKAVNDAAAFLRSLADLRGRNADWGEQAVRSGASISAREALELGVIEIVAADLDDLLTQLDGRFAATASGSRSLRTQGAAIESVEPSIFTRVLAIIAHPNVALLLMMIGIYGIIYEFASPGSIGPGLIGAICLILGLYALNQLPLNYAGLALIILGIGFMVAEAFTPTFGVLGVAGAIAFLLGAGMLIDTDVPYYQLSWEVVIAGLAMTGGFVVLALGYALRAHQRRVRTGREGLLGARGEVITWSGGRGHIWVAGERWSAKGPDALAAGDVVIVVAIEGLTLNVASQASQGD